MYIHLQQHCNMECAYKKCIDIPILITFLAHHKAFSTVKDRGQLRISFHPYQNIFLCIS